MGTRSTSDSYHSLEQEHGSLHTVSTDALSRHEVQIARARESAVFVKFEDRQDDSRGAQATWPAQIVSRDYEQPRGYTAELNAKIGLSYTKSQQVTLFEKQLTKAAEGVLSILSETSNQLISDSVDTARACKQATAQFTAYLTSAIRIYKGDYTEIVAAANDKIEELVAGLQEKFDDAVDDATEEATAGFAARKNAFKEALEGEFDSYFGKIKATMDGALAKLTTTQTKLSALGVTIDVEGTFDPDALLTSDWQKGLKLLFVELSEQEALFEAGASQLKETFSEQVEIARNGANDVISDLLGGEEQPEPNIMFMNQIMSMMGTSIAVAEAVAEGHTLARNLAEQAKGGLSLTEEHGAELEAAFSAKGSTLVQGNSFVDGVKMMMDAEAFAVVGGKVHFNAGMEFTEAFKAQVSAQVSAYIKAGGSMKLIASASLLEGLDVQAIGSFQAMAVATAEAEFNLHLGPLKIDASVNAEARAGLTAAAEGRLTLKPDGTINLTGTANFELGASAVVTGAVKTNFFSLEASVGAHAGLKAEVGGSFSIEGGKLRLKLNVGGALGIGVSGGATIEIDFRKILEAIARKIEAYLMKRWNNRHRNFANPSTLRGRISPEVVSLFGLVGIEACEVDCEAEVEDTDGLLPFNSPKLDVIPHIRDCLISADRQLNLESIESFRADLALYTNGVWKRHYNNRTAALIESAGEYRAEAIVKEWAHQKVNLETAEIWSDVQQSITRAANKRYADVFMITWLPGGSINVPYLSEKNVQAGSGHFDIQAIAASPNNAVQLTFDLVEEVDDEKQTTREASRGDLERVASLTKKHGLDLNNPSKCSKSIDKIVLAFYTTSEAYNSLKADNREGWGKAKAAWFHSSQTGGKINIMIAKYFYNLVGTQYKVHPPTSGKKHPFTVSSISSSNSDDMVHRWILELQGLWSAYFVSCIDESGVIDPTKIGLNEASVLHSAVLDEFTLRWENFYRAFDSDEAVPAFIADIISAFNADGVAYVNGNASALKTELVAQMNRIDSARSELLAHARKIKDTISDADVDKLITAGTELTALASKHAIAIKADVASGEASASALHRTCEVLLDRKTKAANQALSGGDRQLKATLSKLTIMAKRVREQASTWDEERVLIERQALISIKDELEDYEGADAKIKMQFVELAAHLS